MLSTKDKVLCPGMLEGVGGWWKEKKLPNQNITLHMAFAVSPCSDTLGLQ